VQALVLSFPASLDQALLARVIRVVDADQQPVAGRIEIDRQEARWAFTPSSAWWPVRISVGLTPAWRM
jgi:hypothetical protein